MLPVNMLSHAIADVTSVVVVRHLNDHGGVDQCLKEARHTKAARFHVVVD